MPSLSLCHLQNKELDERLKRLQLESSNKSYQEMTRNITRGSNTGVNGIDIQAEGKYFCLWNIIQGLTNLVHVSLPSSVRSIRPILIALLNSVLVIGGTFVFVFKAVEYSMTTPDIVTQVMAALIAALIVALAEVYFLAKIIWSETALSIHRDTFVFKFYVIQEISLQSLLH